MEDKFVYAQCARRKAEKSNAIAEGKAATAKAERVKASKRPAAPASRPPSPPATPTRRPRVRMLRKVKSEELPSASASTPTSVRADAASGEPVVVPTTPSVLDAQVLSSVSQIMDARALRVAEAEAASAALSVAKISERRDDKSLLESANLDLFKTGNVPTPCKPVTASPAQLCPQCCQEMATIVCHGSAVGACLGCKAIWVPNSVVHELAAQSEWHQQVIAAMQTAAARVRI